MKLLNISKLTTKSCKNDIKNILLNSTITEKFDTHYVKIKIINSNKVICCKASGQPITPEDVILNKMWGNFVSDFAYLETIKEFQNMLKQYIGTTIGMFYFPCKQPINIQYRFFSERLYLIHQIYDNYNKCEKSLNNAEVFCSIWNQKYMPDAKINLSITYTCGLGEPLVNDILTTEKISLMHSFHLQHPLIKTLNSEDSEFIIKTENNKYYQISNNKNYQILPDFTERTSFEFVLCDFIKFFNETKLAEKLKGTYKNIVCQCFNQYIKHEKQTKFIEKNIDPKSLQPPHVGYNHGDNICVPYITNQQTINLCNESLLYKNIFKILLINLKSIKKKRYTVYMNDKQISDMNNIVKTIKYLKTEATYENG